MPTLLECYKLGKSKGVCDYDVRELIAHINGYQDKTFKPDNSITRAEFIKIVNKVFGYNTKETENFSDVNQNDWFYNDVCIAVKAGYVHGKLWYWI